MALFNLGYNGTTRVAPITLAPDALPGGAVSLGQFEYADGDIDTMYHHVRDALYGRSAADPSQTAGHPFNIIDMQGVSIERHGPGILAEYITAPAVTVAPLATQAIVLTYQPMATVATNAHFTFVSANPAVATVNASGVVTGVAAGSTTVTATRTNGGMSVVIPVTVTA